MFSKNKAVPSAFKCAVDGQWLSSDHFSQTQIAKWHQKKRQLQDGVTPNTVGLICKHHIEQSQGMQNRLEIHCTGPCDTWKPRHRFSKNQRNIENPRCMECTIWSMNMGANETPIDPPRASLRGQENIDDVSSIQDQATEGRASYADFDITAGSSAIHSTVTQTAGYQSSRINFDAWRDVGDKENLSVVRDVPASKPHSTGRTKGTTPCQGASKDAVMVSGLAKGLGSALQDTQGDVNPPKGEVNLYNFDPFTPSGGAVEDSATGVAFGPGKAPTRFNYSDTGAGAKWAKPESRKVFYAEPAFPGNHENVDTHDPDWDSDEEVDF
ncbi:hypothetical protein F5B19DRAFT_500727 [Rostrohypoxylon terebratum]|nr:hypothetical protein F5B19DRAFT_500727 [Rostrohypoxylon terebratum]